MRHRLSLATGVALLLLVRAADAYLFQPAAVADARTRANAWIKEHPDRGEGYFFLGGIEGSAWAKGSTGKGTDVSVASFGDKDNPPRFVPWESIMYQRDKALAVTPDSLQVLRAALASYRKAVELDPKNPRYQLALGWALEEAAKAKLDPNTVDAPRELTDDERKQAVTAIAELGGSDFAAREHATQTLAGLMPQVAGLLNGVKGDNAETLSRMDAIVQRYWLAQAVEPYRKAYRQSVDLDLKAEQYDAEADATVSVKAGERLLVLLPTQANATPVEVKDVELSLRAIKSKPTLPHFY